VVRLEKKEKEEINQKIRKKNTFFLLISIFVAKRKEKFEM